MRLWACACCRLVADVMNGAGKRTIEVADRYADGRASPAEVDEARVALQAHARPEAPEYPAWAILDPSADDAASVVAWAVPSLEDLVGGQAEPDLHAACIAYLRDIFGNPYRPVAVDPSWRTSTVLALAEGIYQERAFDRLPILADALQDAGCEDEQLLSHCRGAGPHVLGCWAVDILLEKK
jgi:hypothetical protein